MSIQSEVDRINSNVASTYSVLSDLGADMPATRNTDNLPATATSVKAVLFGKSQSLTEAQKAQARTNIGAISAEDVGNIASTEEIVQQVIAALGTPVFGRVDEDNNIILSGELASGTYTLKYEDADGNLTEIGTLKKGSSYTNMIPRSINADGSEYVGTNGEDGYKTNTRINSSAAESASDATGYCVTGFIPVKAGDVIYFKNVAYTPGSSSESGSSLSCYDGSFTQINGTTVKASGLTATYYAYKPVETYADTGYIKSITLADTSLDYRYFRISALGINADSIITVNEPIDDQGTSSEPEIAYTNQIAASINSDGSAFVGANGEDGYKTDTRLNSSGAEATLAGTSVTGFIPVKYGDTVYLQDVAFAPGVDSSGDYLHFYDSSFTKVAGAKSNQFSGIDHIATNATTDASTGYLTSFVLGDESIGYAYMRISAAGLDNTAIITVNEPIV